MTSTIVSQTPDFEAIKTRQRATWSAGDFGRIGVRLQIVGERLAEAMDLRAGQRVLDVAAGNGNATLAAARRFAAVTSTDYVPALLERGRRRAEAEGLDVTFQVADAEALPYPDASFDIVLSTFGVMFAPDHAQTARELMRVCRPSPSTRFRFSIRVRCSRWLNNSTPVAAANWATSGARGSLNTPGCGLPTSTMPISGTSHRTHWNSPQASSVWN